MVEGDSLRPCFDDDGREFRDSAREFQICPMVARGRGTLGCCFSWRRIMPVAHRTFRLNGQKTSWLHCDGRQFKALSGNNGHEDRPDDTAMRGKGPIPRGRYHIIDRQSGRHLGWSRDLVHDIASGTTHHHGLALYRRREDGSASDTTLANRGKRGQFRLHPAGRRGISEGCMTSTEPARFDALRHDLKRHRGIIPGTTIVYYGTMDVQ